MSEYVDLICSDLEHLQGQKSVLIADENALDFPFSRIDRTVEVLSNRIDVVEKATFAGCTAHFSDYDFSPWDEATLDLIVYRLSKEKPVVHHIANQASRRLRLGGKLVLVGGKQEGIKTFAKSIGKLFGTAGKTDKHGAAYTATLTKEIEATTTMDDRDYSALREIAQIGNLPVLSKPGLFGWNKIDRGSELLVRYFPEFLHSFSAPPKTILDLGCGYGYLSLMANRQGQFDITATDNCAAALIACRQNFKHHQITGRVLAADCGFGIETRFDSILCNPPFHQGFHQDRKLTNKFLQQSKHLLHPGGKCLFVVNQFVPLETLAKDYFHNSSVVLSEDGFNLVTLD